MSAQGEIKGGRAISSRPVQDRAAGQEEQAIVSAKALADHEGC